MTELRTLDVPAEVGPVEVRVPGVRATCPVGGGTDLYLVAIAYQADGRTVEAESLCTYLDGFADERVSAEELAARIARKVATALGTAAWATATQVAGERFSVEATAEVRLA